MKNIPKVLVVDDDANLRKTLSDILRIKGYEVASAGTGTDGIAEAQRTFFNVALIDLKLPDMSGLEVMGRIKLITPLTEAIILTGHGALDTAIEATNKGAYSYLLKPYDIDDLLLHIRHVIELQRSQQEIVRLASFPQVDPNPVIEVDASGEVTYRNPAAELLFPELVQARPGDGVLADIRGALGDGERKRSVREVRVGDATFEQFFYPVPDSDLTRIYMLDITEREKHEARLNRINLLLLTIRKINEYLLVADSQEALYRFVCEALKGLEDIAGVVIGIKLPDYMLKMVAWAGFSDAMVSALDVRGDATAPAGGIMGLAAREGRSIVIADIQNDARFAPLHEMAQEWQLKSAAAVPLVAEGEAIGVLAMYSTQRDAFDQQITSFLADAATDLAIGVRSQRLRSKLEATLGSLRKSLYGTVEAVARMVETRDPYTAGHERRVAQLSSTIGKEMGLRERQIEGLRVTGYLHDIGKIAVPAEILSKPVKLTEIEFAMIRSHSKIGYDILKDMEFPWPVAQAVLQHHERLDGSGYPAALNAGDIILEARVLMVADVVEAMATHRPYRASLGLEAAIGEINSNRGKLYDPDVVDACVRLFAEHRFAFDGVK